jgi:hypothetical protein
MRLFTTKTLINAAINNLVAPTLSSNFFVHPLNSSLALLSSKKVNTWPFSITLTTCCAYQLALRPIVNVTQSCMVESKVKKKKKNCERNCFEFYRIIVAVVSFHQLTFVLISFGLLWKEESKVNF